MNASNSWAEFAELFRDTQAAHTDHERAKSELKGLMPEDAKEAMGHGIRAKRSKSGAISFDIGDICTPPDGSGANLRPALRTILKAKNRLSADDAKLVEDAFAARMALQGSLPDAWTTDAPTTPAPTRPTPPQPPSASTDAVKPRRPRGRPGKVKAAPEQSAAPPVPSKPLINDNRPASVSLQAHASPRNIDKSVLAISEPRRYRDKAHLKFVASHPCLICERSPADAHHLRFAQPRAMGLKVSDEFTVPLCRTHHRNNHRFGDEQAWWDRWSINPVETSRKLWVLTRRIE